MNVLRVTIEMYTKTYTDLHIKGISGFLREVDENFVHLNYYAASNENSLPTFREKPIGPIFKGRESILDP